MLYYGGLHAPPYGLGNVCDGAAVLFQIDADLFLGSFVAGLLGDVGGANFAFHLELLVGRALKNASI